LKKLIDVDSSIASYAFNFYVKKNYQFYTGNWNSIVDYNKLGNPDKLKYCDNSLSDFKKQEKIKFSDDLKNNDKINIIFHRLNFKAQRCLDFILNHLDM
jgi:hypothetical protein